MRQQINLGIVLVTAAAITYYSVRPLPIGPYEPSGISITYLYHGVAYFFLAGALLLYFHDTPRGHVEAVLIASLFGAIIELLQYGVPGRYFSIVDLLVNTAGAALILLDHRVTFITVIIHAEDQILERILH